MKSSRRQLLQAAAAGAATRSAMLQAAAVDAHWPRLEASDTPKLALELSDSGPLSTSPGTGPWAALQPGGWMKAACAG